jgi:hypothetical protein
MDRRALKKVAVRLNGGAVRGSSANLARVMGVSQASVRSWLTDPDDETTYRRMTRGARRLLATMVLLHGAGLLDEKLLAGVDTYDLLLNEGDARLDRALQALQASTSADGADDDQNEDEE